MGAHLTVEQRRRVRQLRSDGMRVAEVAREAGCSLRTVKRVVAGQGTREERATRWSPGQHRLSLQEREEISIGLRREDSFSAIGRQLGRSTSTVSREVKANGGREGYRAWRAHDRAYFEARRPKGAKLDCPRLAGQVVEWLEEWWSPEEIARRLPIEFPDDPMMRVSHETIYQSIYVQGRGELGRELARCLRAGRAQRRPRHRVETRGRIPDMVMISERPGEADDRAVPGHWEGDLIIGKNGRSAVGTLVERTTGYLFLLHLPDGKEAEKVDAAMRGAVTKLAGEFFRTITWDQGKEMAKHASFTIDTGIQVYFCDPHSPWQRPSNENTNGLLRQYMPKGTDLSLLTEADLDAIARSLNNRPRKRLDFMKPSERLAELLAMTG
ncbi:MAG TPA: IS30 family transposase [Acidimicrobiales bacterium]|nr:IS30 family transposase [Acidimicrobiales bacterium]